MKSNPLRQVDTLGQAIWFNHVRDDLIARDGCRCPIDEDGLPGMTSNSFIFEKAIEEDHDCDTAIAAQKGFPEERLPAPFKLTKLAGETIQTVLTNPPWVFLLLLSLTMLSGCASFSTAKKAAWRLNPFAAKAEDGITACALQQELMRFADSYSSMTGDIAYDLAAKAKTSMDRVRPLAMLLYKVAVVRFLKVK